jgi:hypothetical protein
LPWSEVPFEDGSAIWNARIFRDFTEISEGDDDLLAAGGADVGGFVSRATEFLFSLLHRLCAHKKARDELSRAFSFVLFHPESLIDRK